MTHNRHPPLTTPVLSIKLTVSC